jgi:hypothetical protein
MLISDAQRGVRTAYLGGFVGQIVSGMIWLVSAAIATFVDPRTGFWTLAIGGAAIFPLTQAILRLAGRGALLDRPNPLTGLGMQVALTVPFVLPLAGAAAIQNAGWFYPACLAVLAVALIVVGYVLGFLAPDRVVLGGWAGGLILFAFAFVLLTAYKRDSTDRAGVPS